MWETATRISTMTTAFGRINARTPVENVQCYLRLLSRRKSLGNVNGLRDPIKQNQCKNFFNQSKTIQSSFPSLSAVARIISCPISASARTWTRRSGTGRTIVKTAAENAYPRWSFQTRWCNARARVTRCLVKSAPRNGSSANVWLPRRNEAMRRRVRRRRRTSARRVGRRNRRRRSRERS